MTRRQVDPGAQTIEDAARALAAVLAERHEQTRFGAGCRSVLWFVHERWADLTARLADLDRAVAEHPITPPTPDHFTNNEEAQANRQRKASQIADWAEGLPDGGLTPDQLAALEPLLRRLPLAREVGQQSTPSTLTWARAVELLRQRHVLRAARRGASRVNA